jgi:hypothetical protein
VQKPTDSGTPLDKLNPRLSERLGAYAFAATAAGVGILVSAQGAEAKVVFTPANTQIAGFVPLDLNHDAVADFFLVRSGRSNGHSDSGWLSASPLNTNNRVLGHGTVKFFRQNPTVAFALPAGFEVGPKAKGFQPAGKKLMAGYWFASSTGGFFSQGFAGPWANDGQGVTNRYLGLAFQISGQVHFGWARLTLAPGAALTATLTGYAYETIPNKSIVTGITQDDATTAGASPFPAGEAKAEAQSVFPMLGVLALGHEGIAIWRREDS